PKRVFCLPVQKWIWRNITSITRGSFDFAYFPQDAGKWVSVHTRIVEFHHAEIHNVQRAVLPPFHLDGTFQSSGILADAGKPFLL
ncbi:MAG: hypothetical protein KKG00_15170, partial [Bacteroidetes bacterium]|nr:hypothetical protein [Bacteroidota bacterium]